MRFNQLIITKLGKLEFFQISILSNDLSYINQNQTPGTSAFKYLLPPDCRQRNRLFVSKYKLELNFQVCKECLIRLKKWNKMFQTNPTF